MNRFSARWAVAVALATAFLLSGGCATRPQVQSEPVSPATVRAMAVQPVAPTFHLLITFPYEMSVFTLRLYSTTNLSLPFSQWKLVTVLPTLRSNIWPVWATNGQEFFFGTASNSINGLVSGMQPW